jgi:glycerophosphoryl diester phosphodiesterase
MVRYNGSAINKFITKSTGTAAAGTKITIKVTGVGSLANLFDNVGMPLANPVTADSNGNFWFYVDPGNYDLIFNAGLPSEVIIYDEPIVDVPEDDGTLVKNVVTLTSGQNIVIFTSIVASGAAVYLNGTGADDGRLHEDADYILRPDIDAYTIELSSTYAAGSTITAYNYSSAGGISFNLSNEDLKIDVVAHRGFQNSFPQNTMLAFASCIRRGATALECDVQITLDGVPVVFHDDTVNALTDGSGTISSLTLAQVQSLTIDEVAGTAFSNCRIPTFAELLRYCKGAGLRIFPEIKKYRAQSDISLMIDDVINANMEGQAYFSSFSYSDVVYFRTLNSQIVCGLLGSSTNPTIYEANINDLSALGNSIIIWNYPALLTQPNIVLYARSMGVDVAAWTVDDNTAAKDVMRVGVTKIITNVALEVL